MKILYISSTKAGMLGQSIYYDLMQEFVDNGHDVYCVYANEKRYGLGTEQHDSNGIHYLGVKTGDLSKNPNLISKGIATLRIDSQFKAAIKKYFINLEFDLVLVSTPPITFTRTLKYFKMKDITIYLMLKDIFPQNAVDLDLFTNNGLIHNFFIRKEKTSYELSDLIGCMSQANIDFVAHKYPNFTDKLRLLPNAIKITKPQEPKLTKSNYGLNEEDLLLLYGGNIGLPQGPSFILECIKKLESIQNVKLIIAGSGSHMPMIENYVLHEKLQNTLCVGQLDVDTYNDLTAICDIGLIFLDYRFTIPNYPQRLLSYLKESKPVICATDTVSDIGSNAEQNGYGFRVASNDSDAWIQTVNLMKKNQSLRNDMGMNGFKYLSENFDVNTAYKSIINQLKEKSYV